MNDQPQLTIASTVFTINENVAVGTAVSSVLTAIDEDEDALAVRGFLPRFRYSLTCLNSTFVVHQSTWTAPCPACVSLAAS